MVLIRVPIIKVAIIITDTRLLRLLQLSSASLPVGGYSFSQGLEYAIDAGWITNEEHVADWVGFVMRESIAQVDLPLLLRLLSAIEKDDANAFYYWNAYSLACRETHELLLTETAMGDALVRLLTNLQITLPNNTCAESQKVSVSFVSAFAVAASHWAIDKKSTLLGFLWAWLESQIAAATKLVPLGQTSAQKLLLQIGSDIDSLMATVEQVNDEAIGSSLPGLAMASSWHETQYSRLFRS